MAAAPEKQPQQDTTDQSQSTQSFGSAHTAERMLEDNRRDEKRDSGTDSTSTSNAPENADAQTGDSATAQQGTESVADHMRREVEETWQAATEAVSSFSRMLTAGISPETAAKFGTPEMFDSANGDGDAAQTDSRIEAATTEAKKAEREKAASPESSETGKESSLGSMLSDLGSWAADTFNEYVMEPATEMLGDVADVFSAAGDWMFENANEFTSAAATDPALRGLNDVSTGEFNSQEVAATRGLERINLAGATDASGQGLELPADAVEAGTVEIGGNTVTVMKTPDGDTYLKRGDKVIAKQGEDGSYELALKDGSRLEFNMSEGEDGKFNLDKMERFKGDQLKQKYQDGVYYNYNYDADGNRTSVDAAADIDGPLTQEKLDQIRAELGDNGAATLRVRGEDGKNQRMLLQTHDSKTHSLTDIDAHRAQIFHDGQEYRLNEKDQLARVNSDGQEETVEASEDAQRQEVLDKIRELKHRLDRRARGDGEERVGDIGIEDQEDGSTEITRFDQTTGEPQTVTEVPSDAGKPIEITNSDGEVAKIERDRISVEDVNDKPIFEFDRNIGLTTPDMKVDGDGLTDLESLLKLNPDGQLTDMDGNFILTETYGEEFFGGEECEDCAEFAENEEISNESSSEISQLGSISLSISRSGNPAAISVAKSIASEAFGIASAALSAIGNDVLNAIPIQLSLSVAQSAYDQAARSERTQTYAMRMGISDTTRLSDFNRIGTLSTTSFSPEEFVRDRLKVA